MKMEDTSGNGKVSYFYADGHWREVWLRCLGELHFSKHSDAYQLGTFHLSVAYGS